MLGPMERQSRYFGTIAVSADKIQLSGALGYFLSARVEGESMSQPASREILGGQSWQKDQYRLHDITLTCWNLSNRLHPNAVRFCRRSVPVIALFLCSVPITRGLVPNLKRGCFVLGGFFGEIQQMKYADSRDVKGLAHLRRGYYERTSSFSFHGGFVLGVCAC